MRGTRQRALLFLVPGVPGEFILGLVGLSKKHEIFKTHSSSYSSEDGPLTPFPYLQNCQTASFVWEKILNIALRSVYLNIKIDCLS